MDCGLSCSSYCRISHSPVYVELSRGACPNHAQPAGEEVEASHVSAIVGLARRVRPVPCGRGVVAGRGRPPQAAARRAGLEDVEKVLTAVMAGAGGELTGQAGAPTREPFWLDRHGG
jgi:hypothetical protein